MKAVCALLFASLFPAFAQLPSLKVSENQRFLVTASGKPFFYLADTAWELFHRLNRQQAASYIDLRASQGYTALQAVAIAELDGVTDPNANGDLPFFDKDPLKPNPRYWTHVDAIIDLANRRGLYIALLPTWGRWVKDEPILTVANAAPYGEFLGKRYARKGIIWVLGGDRTAAGYEEVWRAMAKGIAAGAGGTPLMTYHPRGGETSSTSFHNDPWLDVNMQQNGHGIPGVRQPWKYVTADYEKSPVKPVIDGEPLYEDHPLAFRARDNGYSFDAHVRQYAWWDVFSGAAGHTYGNHAVWQMHAPGRKPVNGPLMNWNEAIHRPGAAQMQYVRRLVESRDYLSRVPDQSLIVNPLAGPDYIAATRGSNYAFVYSGQGRKFSVRMGKIPGTKVRASWYNPRNGASIPAGEFDNSGEREFTCPSEGFGSDWVLVLDSL